MLIALGRRTACTPTVLALRVAQVEAEGGVGVTGCGLVEECFATFGVDADHAVAAECMLAMILLEGMGLGSVQAGHLDGF